MRTAAGATSKPPQWKMPYQRLEVEDRMGGTLRAWVHYAMLCEALLIETKEGGLAQSRVERGNLVT